MRTLLIAGCGFAGKAAARLFHQAGWAVSALTRTGQAAAALSGEPYPVFACDITGESGLAILRERIGPREAVLHCVSSGRGGADEYLRAYFVGAQNLWRTFSPAKFLFTSSTSVYAQTDGSWVDEDSSPAEPARETGTILRRTEKFVLEQGGCVARLAGLYGPGRSVLLEKFLDGRAVIEGDGSRWINQIHRDDAAGALLFLLDHTPASGIYNVADDSPLTQLECYRWLAEHFRKPMPTNGPPNLDRKRGWTSKRVSNRKLRELGWSCKYPSFKEAVLKDADLLKLTAC